MNYTNLTQDERYQIYAYKQTGMSPSLMAIKLSRDKSTIFREFKRNTGGRGYRPKQAQEMATERHKNAFKAIKMTDEVINIIERRRYV